MELPDVSRNCPVFLGFLRDGHGFSQKALYVILRASGMMSPIFAVMNATETERYGH